MGTLLLHVRCVKPNVHSFGQPQDSSRSKSQKPWRSVGAHLGAKMSRPRCKCAALECSAGGFRGVDGGRVVLGPQVAREAANPPARAKSKPRSGDGIEPSNR